MNGPFAFPCQRTGGGAASDLAILRISFERISGFSKATPFHPGFGGSIIPGNTFALFPDHENQLITDRKTKHQEITMSIVAWIVLGLVAGFIASKIVDGNGQGALIDILLGIVGSVVGGWLFNTFGMPCVVGFNVYSLLVAVIGASVVLALYHLVTRSSRS
jgi:uncharacterized membrane protein YeaQ/YmgE (transglycosylase-associated protein family)